MALPASAASREKFGALAPALATAGTPAVQSGGDPAQGAPIGPGARGGAAGTGEECAPVQRAVGARRRCGPRRARKCQAVPAPRPAPGRPEVGSLPGRRGAGEATAPAVSKLRAEAGFGALPRRALAQYLLLLRRYPVLTKAATSGVLSALGNVLTQMIEKKSRKKENSTSLDVSGPLRYAVYGFFFTGPLSHYFYLFLEHWIPPEVPLAGVKRLLLERLLVAPAFLLLFFLIMNFLQGQDAVDSVATVRAHFWPALRTNWRVWTPMQFININYIPLQFRVLFANLVALFWYAYLASLGK
uniref:Peroxisomal membrane protein 2 n=1 Tax=Prolemur simus TaxID=1328070 RepID=A0A8C8ZDT3_PROSS